MADRGLYGVANRAVYVLDDGTVTDDWVADTPKTESDYDELVDTGQST